MASRDCSWRTGRVHRRIETGQVQQRRTYYPDLYHPAVCYFNSSVAAFVEVAWRWRAAAELLRANPGPRYTAPLKEHEQHREEVERSREMFLARMTVPDSAVGEALGDREPGP
jgi:hypothetical protein